MSKYVFDIGDYGVVWDDTGFYVTKTGVSVADVLCAFEPSQDGLSLAICYAMTRHGRDINKATGLHWPSATLWREDAARIYKMGRSKAHRAWIDNDI